MRVITTVQEMQEIIQQVKAEKKSVGFVPTMGFLHEGHLTLLRNARKENDIVAMSIFVNPLQFGPNEDFATYPRDFERDRSLAEKENIDFLFYPSVAEMYPSEASISVIVKDRTDVLCGKSRPGHFDGVATVLTKLFNIMMPTRAYFGKKDAQQVAVIDSLIKDFNFPIKLIPVDIVREENGLAKSSRNVNLEPYEREQAAALYRSLQKARSAIEEGERDIPELKKIIETTILNESQGNIDYIEIYSYPELKPIDKASGSIIMAIAVKFSKVRLIDNIIMSVK
ncbi:pantoate--beta-alanine ligase [Neobacillus terrae]|uniref:pantoate--beta-alanine ligase n=1 Tax=Neobacillus terrae TaxID=3034837 RepID=UPI00140E6E87|nr:pantoate--beta-alanine ligase [Neobacillus terrae]NHM29151.1 pantoate--beta-alanine ligase [Neobacillus terrae]